MNKLCFLAMGCFLTGWCLPCVVVEVYSGFDLRIITKANKRVKDPIHTVRLAWLQLDDKMKNNYGRSGAHKLGAVIFQDLFRDGAEKSSD